jgi:hypothetical protein
MNGSTCANQIVETTGLATDIVAMQRVDCEVSMLHQCIVLTFLQPFVFIYAASTSLRPTEQTLLPKSVTCASSCCYHPGT